MKMRHIRPLTVMTATLLCVISVMTACDIKPTEPNGSGAVAGDKSEGTFDTHETGLNVLSDTDPDDTDTQTVEPGSEVPDSTQSQELASSPSQSESTGNGVTETPEHVCVSNSFGVCESCGKTDGCRISFISDCGDLPREMMWYSLAEKYRMQGSTELVLNSDGSYTLEKKVLYIPDGTSSPRAVCAYSFQGTYVAVPEGVFLNRAVSGHGETDMSGICHIRNSCDSGINPEVLNLFPTAYLCEGMTNTDMTVSVDEKGDYKFVCADVSNDKTDEELTYALNRLPSRIASGRAKQSGRVEEIVYESFDYNNNVPHENTMYVYLPYGYDESSPVTYNVLYLLHGSGENAAYWLAQRGYAGGYTEQTRRVLDNLHYYGICEPTIVVTPTENLNGTAMFWKELEEIIIPLIETRYRTRACLYGLDPGEVNTDDMIASRNYRAFAGLSLGSIITWDIMARQLDKFAYYGFYSGGTCNADRRLMLKKTLRDPENSIYDIKFAYHSCGTDDVMYSDHLSDYKLFARASDMLRDGENTVFLSKQGFTHSYASWVLDLYNSLAFAFFKH